MVRFLHQMIRSCKPREENALLWVGASQGLIAASIWRLSFDIFAQIIGSTSATSLLHLARCRSLSHSCLAEQWRIIAREVALLMGLLPDPAMERRGVA